MIRRLVIINNNIIESGEFPGSVEEAFDIKRNAEGMSYRLNGVDMQGVKDDVLIERIEPLEKI